MIEKVIIMGAAGRDFHNFNIYFKDNPRYEVIGFTATQIPDIEGRIYPPELSGKLYPKGVPVYSENLLTDLIREHKVDLVAFSYSDIPHTDVMHKASMVMACGADFILIGATYTMLKSKKTVIAVCAVRTGCGKSQTTRHICNLMKSEGKNVVAIRHPMPYGDLTHQVVQRFASYEDIKKQQCTIEEREEYEPLISQGIVVYSGIDYEQILKAAEEEADVIVWDGGNNDTPFYYPDVHIVIFDPHRAGHELLYYPGETNMLMADIAVINKVDSASPDQIETVRKNIETHAPDAKIVLAESDILVDDPEKIKGRRVLVIEDGPTLTHGGMSHGAGILAANLYGAAEIIDPRAYAVGTIKHTYSRHPNIGSVLPAMGYSNVQIRDLELTINKAECDLVLCATPIDLPKLLTINKPIVRTGYEYKDHSNPFFKDVLFDCLKKI